MPRARRGARSGCGRRRGRWSTTRSRTAPTPSSPTRCWRARPTTEPHYLRQAQRYLGHAVRCLRASGRPIRVVTLADAMEPDQLEWFGRALPDEDAKRVHDCVDSLSAEQRRGLAGTRDRLAILAESDVVNFLYRREPTRHNIDL